MARGLEAGLRQAKVLVELQKSFVGFVVLAPNYFDSPHFGQLPDLLTEAVAVSTRRAQSPIWRRKTANRKGRTRLRKNADKSRFVSSIPPLFSGCLFFMLLRLFVATKPRAKGSGASRTRCLEASSL